eukprot:scaffold62036_cov32-Tisochrysis_lutea.AAC.1
MGSTRLCARSNMFKPLSRGVITTESAGLSWLRTCAPNSTTRFMFMNSHPAPNSSSDSRAQPFANHALVCDAH